MAKAKEIGKKNAPKPAVSGIWYKIALAALVLVLYGRTVNYEFVLDDGLIIVNNPVVQQGATGIFETFSQGSVTHFKGSNFQIYRPAFISLLCIEKQIFGMEPKGFHFVNILLYAWLAIVIFNLLRLLLPRLHDLYRFLITALFIAHPIHTEVVANVKSQDELIASIGCLLALTFFIRAADREYQRAKYMLFSVIAFLPALFSKESSFAFVILFPLFLFLFRGESIWQSLKRSWPLIAASLFFLGSRYLAIHDINIAYATSPVENILYAAKTTSEQIGTKLEIAFYYLRMMVYPHPMAWDYSYNQIPVLPFTHAIPVLSLLLYALLAFLFFRNLRRQPAVSFGIAFFVALSAPTASLFFPNGTTFADRFLFMPSLGFILAIVYLIADMLRVGPESVSPASRKLIWGTGITLTVICSAVSINRASDWKDNYSVFRSGAMNSPNSSRTNEGLATTYTNLAQEAGNPAESRTYIDSAVMFMEKSLKIFPGNNYASYKLAMIYQMTGQTDKAISYYRQSINSKPDYVLALNNLGSLYFSQARYDSAFYLFRQSLQSDSANPMTLINLTIVTAQMDKWTECVNYGNKVLAMNISNAKVYKALTYSYERLGNTEKAKLYRALYDANPNAK